MSINYESEIGDLISSAARSMDPDEFDQLADAITAMLDDLSDDLHDADESDGDE